MGLSMKPQKAQIDIAKLARDCSVHAFLRIIEISKMIEEDPRLALAANQYIIDRVLGKPFQAVNIGDSDGKPMSIVVNVLSKVMDNTQSLPLPPKDEPDASS